MNTIQQQNYIMKKLLLLLLVTTAVSYANDGYMNQIVQTHADGTTHMITPLAAAGTSYDADGVVDSSVFRLWTIRLSDNAEYLLDEKTVSSYHPQGIVKINTGDPYTHIPRTRVDQAFSVEFEVSGIVTDDPSVHDAAKSVIFDHRTTEYASGESEALPGAHWDTHDHDPIISNGTHNFSNIVTQIQAADLTQARGEEVFSIYANPDFGVGEGATLLDHKRVQIWPIASATVSGIDTSVEYTKIPEVNVNLVDLYPNSTTYIRVYEGEPSATPVSPLNINTSFVIVDDVKPVNRSYNVTSLDTRITEDGIYTMEVIHETPFGADLLYQTYPLKVERSIKINGNVNSSE